MQITRWTISLVVCLVPTMMSASAQQSSGNPFSREAACRTLELASTGGPLPADRNVVVLRWLATSNFEIAYRDNVFLLDTYYDRAAPARPLGFDFKRMNKATAIFVGHAHSDHASDAVAVAQQTGARVFGGPPTYDFVRAGGLPEKQAVLTRGGETFKFNGVTVQAILAHHSDRPGDQFRQAGEGFRQITGALIRPRTAEEQAHATAIGARGSRDPSLAKQGTIAYLFTFDNGFRVYYQDSAGPLTEAQMELMKTIPNVDVAIVPYQGFYLSEPQILATMPLIRLVKPRIVVPNHHDETGGSFPDLATEPLFMAIRDGLPGTRTYSLLYRSPMCINTSTGQVFVGPGDAGPTGRR
ncbi:MAG: MBL fold metallo-hydrolase [Acidobacteria bacterium]|nr:MBL fold metallo-hydrolase [Acidobacteriota bacterium]